MSDSGESRSAVWNWVPHAIIAVIMAMASFGVSTALDSLEAKIQATQVSLSKDVNNLNDTVKVIGSSLTEHRENHPSKIIFVELGVMKEKIASMQRRLEKVEE